MNTKIEKLLKDNPQNIKEAVSNLKEATVLLKRHTAVRDDISSSVFALPHKGKPWTRILSTNAVESLSGAAVFADCFPGFEGKPSVQFFAADTKTLTLLLSFIFRTVDKLPTN